MNRQQYINLRSANLHMEILYEFCVEKGLKGIPIMDFNSYIIAWAQELPQGQFNFYIQSVLEMYDRKFIVTLVEELRVEEHIDMLGRTNKQTVTRTIRII